MAKSKWIVGGLGLVYAGVGAMIFNNVQKPRTYSHEKSFEFDKNQGSYTDQIKEIDKKIIRIPSQYGYFLYAHWMPYEGSKKTVILVHGITSNIYGAMKYYELYRNMGFNVLAYDHRNHGKSGGTGTTLGYHEKHDLEACVQWVNEVVGPDGHIGTHGESMGGGTVIQHAGAYNSIDFVVADCPFADLSRELRQVSQRENTFPMWMAIPAASFISKITGNGWYSESSPIKVIDQVQSPLLIIHGEADTYITPDHAQELYDGKVQGIRRLYYAKGADHAQAIIKDRENYSKQVHDFLQALGLEVLSVHV